MRIWNSGTQEKKRNGSGFREWRKRLEVRNGDGEGETERRISNNEHRISNDEVNGNENLELRNSGKETKGFGVQGMEKEVRGQERGRRRGNGTQLRAVTAAGRPGALPRSAARR